MIILACETSTLLGSVAVLENERVLSVVESMRQGSHSDTLNIFIERALEKAGKKLSDVDLFASGIGPGSFTGLRISLNTIKTLAYCHQKPVAGISSLRTLATAASKTEFSNIPIVSMINAFKNMVYVAQYEVQNHALKEIKKPEVLRVQNLESYLPDRALICGDAFTTYEKFFPENLRQKMQRSNLVSDEPRADTLGLIAFADPALQQSWNQLLPLYLRASEAEENMNGIKYQPLI